MRSIRYLHFPYHEPYQAWCCSMRTRRHQRKAWAGEITDRCGAELIQAIGQTASFYRRHPEKPVIDPGK